MLGDCFSKEATLGCSEDARYWIFSVIMVHTFCSLNSCGLHCDYHAPANQGISLRAVSTKTLSISQGHADRKGRSLTRFTLQHQASPVPGSCLMGRGRQQGFAGKAAFRSRGTSANCCCRFYSLMLYYDVQKAPRVWVIEACRALYLIRHDQLFYSL